MKSLITDNTQTGYYPSNAYSPSGTALGLDVAPGLTFAFRFPTFIPAGATIDSATLVLPFGVKDGNVYNTASFTMSADDSPDSPHLNSGEQLSARTSTHEYPDDIYPDSANVLFSITWNAGETGAHQANLNVAALIRHLIAMGQHPGGHITFFVQCDSETGNMNLAMAGTAEWGNQPPELTIVYTESTTTQERWDFNTLPNPSFWNDTAAWGQNDMFGANTTNSTITRDTSFTFKGRPTMKFTAGPPDGTKSAAFVNVAKFPYPNSSYIFCGWVYIPSSVTTDVPFGFAFQPPDIVTQRDQWVPFCSPLLNVTNQATGFVAGGMAAGFTQGQSIWVADCAVFKSHIQQRSFTPFTDAEPQVSYFSRGTYSSGTSGRKIRPKVKVPSAPNPSVPKNTWVRDTVGDSSIWVLAPSKKV